MSFTTKITDAVKDVEIKTDTALEATNLDLLTLLSALGELSRITPLASFTYLVWPLNPNRWDYKFKAKDNRKWDQIIDFSGAETAMNFTVPDFWSLREFTPH